MTTIDVDIRESWSTIEAALREQAPQLIATLGPPASDQELADVERKTGLQLPEDLTASLRCHNGQRDLSRSWSFTDGGMLLSTDGIVERWQIADSVHRDLLNRPPPVAGHCPLPWWKTTLIPFTDAEGDMLCVDTDVALGPRRGEVIWHVHDDGLTAAVAESYCQWLKNVASKLCEGSLRVDERGSSVRSDR